MAKDFPRSKQTENAIGSMLMYLYQAYTEEQGLSQEQAKNKVVETIEEGLKKFEGEQAEKEQEEPKIKVSNTFAIHNIKNSIGLLKQHANYRSVKYLVDTIDFNFNKLIEDSRG